MCGIAGRFNFDPLDRSIATCSAAMTDAMAHRGPDADGYLRRAGIGLGHRRLSIIDLSTGDQPLTNEDGTDLGGLQRRDLQLRRHPRRARGARAPLPHHSDTEVIVHAYEAVGRRCVERFRGMFAFALWDDASGGCCSSRDRLGVKPLYYSRAPGRGISFGSEIKALLEDPDVPREWSAEAHRRLPDAAVHPGAARRSTAASRSCRPAHVLVAERGRVTRVALLGSAVHRRRRSGARGRIPRGARRAGHRSRSACGWSATCRSARSSPAASTRARRRLHGRGSASPRRSRSSVGFDERRSTKLRARRTRRATPRLRIPRARSSRPTSSILLPKLAWHFDEPFADSSAVPTYYVSKAAREHVTVALSGDGGDELWAGYARHRVEQLGTARAQLRSARPARARRMDRPRAAAVGQGRAVAAAPGLDAGRGVRPASTPTACSSRTRRRDCTRATSRAAVARRRSVRHASAPPTRDCRRPIRWTARSTSTSTTYMVDDILTKVDRMSMAVSLEAREPLLDHKLLEFAATGAGVAQAEERPAASTCCGGCSSGACRKRSSIAASRDSQRRSASGCAGRSRRWSTRCCSTAGCATAASSTPRESTRLWREHRGGARDHPHRLWQLVMLELWFRQFVDGPRSAGPARRGSRRLAATDAGERRPDACAASPESSRPTARRRRPRARDRGCATSSRIAGPTKRAASATTRAALAHRRLSIVDLAAGQQPLSNEDGTRLGRLQRRDLQPRRRPRASSKRPGHATARGPTPRRSSTPTSSGATTASTASAACSRSRSGTRRGGGCCWRAIGSASSRSTGRAPAARLLFASEIKAILESGLIRPRAERRGAARAAEHALHLRRRDDVQGHPRAAARAHRWSSSAATSRIAAVLGHARPDSAPIRDRGARRDRGRRRSGSASCSRSRSGCG